MPDYGHELLFGSILTPVADRPGEVVAAARIADAAGLDLVAVPDHPYQPGFLDAWATLSVIAAVTQRIRVLPDVANLPLRPPATLARTAAGLDLLSGGRVELGLGAGAYWDSITAEGGPHRSPGEAVAATREAIEILRALWAGGGRVHFEGKHHHLAGAAAGPAPAHPISVWLGAVGPRMLRLTGAAADGWLPSVPHVPPPRLARGQPVIDEAAERAGRKPEQVRRLYNLSPGPGGFPQGAPRDWPEQLAQLTVEVGTSAYLLPSGRPELIRTFAEEVAPATRELVTAARARGDEPRTSRTTTAAAEYAPRRRRPGTGSGAARPDTA